MACKNCAKIRSAILHGKMAEAAGLTVTALREKIGLGVTEKAELVGEAGPELVVKTTKRKPDPDAPITDTIG